MQGIGWKREEDCSNSSRKMYVSLPSYIQTGASRALMMSWARRESRATCCSLYGALGKCLKRHEPWVAASPKDKACAERLRRIDKPHLAHSCRLWPLSLLLLLLLLLLLSLLRLASAPHVAIFSSSTCTALIGYRGSRQYSRTPLKGNLEWFWW